MADDKMQTDIIVQRKQVPFATALALTKTGAATLVLSGANVSFTGNWAFRGGALAVVQSNVSLEGCRFSDNVAVAAAGALR